MAEITLTLRVVKPWWWSCAVWLSAMPLFARYALSGLAPTNEETDAFARRWAGRLRFVAE